MNLIKHVSLVVLFFISTLTSFAQAKSDDAPNLSNGTIDQQFDYVLRKSGNFKGTNGQAYEAVKRSMFLTLRAHTIDSLNTLKSKLESSKNTVETQQKEIDDLKSSLNSTQSTLEATNLEKDSMSLLGMQMSKTNYNVLMWTIIAGLLALFILFVYKFNNSNAVTRDAKKALAEIEEEFDDHRRTALEREQKVRRQLQDEINKQKGI
ncbi:tRNA (guanine-N1)-methyltransferase [Hwangdonia lutea]|uniref:tRNA (Guanine-N1)-methyltransferase n=1 Tax=Hwangdonia lutea TaxID=3075823 RepID=A0AA97ELK9_9FLAO|nr:tRNA (guanine-N1)-methyltransferase [Hwangdonia sp. SCSIO 19198]WOD43676.1 tRNA (guanine-N1)-methyltransferase [Hwangdonia sp. SCSIO 19198]